MFGMKKLLIILVLFLSLLGCERNYIKDFKIEGIGLGDSLLDHFSEENILNNQMNYFQNNEFKESVFVTTNISSEYDDISVMYRNNDEKFIVESIQGGIFYDNNVKECYPKKDEIIEKLSSLLKDVEWTNNNYEDDDGSFENTRTELKSGEYIVVQCYDWNKKIKKEKEWTDHLRVSIESKEYYYWINFVAVPN